MHNKGFIAVGHTVLVDFGELAFKLQFHDDAHTMTFVGVGEKANGITDTVTYTAIEIRPKVYMVYWKEAKKGDAVVHVEDYEFSRVWTNISQTDGAFINLAGSLKILDEDTTCRRK